MKSTLTSPSQRSLLRRSLLTLALGMALGQSVQAQDTSGAIFGRLPSGQSGKIVVENVETGLRREVVAGEDGRFRLPGLPNGRYRVMLDRDGETITESAVMVNAGAGSEVVLGAGTGDTTELDGVLVTAAAGNVIDVSTVESPLVVSANDLQKMPIAPNITSIALLAPGVTDGDSRYFQGGRFASLPSFGGSAVSENAYYINGFPVTNPLLNYGFTELPYNGVDQVQLSTGGYGVEYGRSTGGVVNVITKRGTNEWKVGGQVIWRPETLSAAPRNIYYADTGRPEAGTIQQYMNENQFDRTTVSAYAGGPIVKDKLFIYAAAEFVKQEGGETDSVNGLVTSANATRTGWNEYSYRTPRWLLKGDWNINDNHRLEVTGFSDRLKRSTDSYGFDYATLSHNDVQRGGLYRDDNTKTWIGQYTGRLTDDLSITAMYGESDTDKVYEPYAYDPTCPRISFVAGGQVPGLVYNNCQNAPSSRINLRDTGDKVKNGRFDIEYVLGDHALKMGYDYNEARSTTGQQTPGGNTWQYLRSSTPTDAIDPSQGVRSPASGGGYGVDGYYALRLIHLSSSDVKVEQTAVYLKDLWQVSDNVMLELGVRSEGFSNYNTNGDAFAKKENQIAPRFGVTWDVNGDSSLKLFANAGRYHLAMPNNVAVRGADSVINTTEAFTYTGVDPITGAPTGLVSLGPVYSANNEFGIPKDPRIVAATNLKSHYQDAFSFGMEQNLGAFNVGAKASYRNLRSAIDDFCDFRPFIAAAVANGMDPDVAQGFEDRFTCAIFNPGVGNSFWQDVDGDGTLERYDLSAAQLGYPKLKRKYYGIDLFLERPFDGKWYARVDYTFSKNWGNTEGQLLSDIGQLDVSATQAFDFPELMEHANGLLPNHRKHQLKARGYYQLTDEWTLSGNFLYASGRPRNCLGIYPDRDNPGSGYRSSYFYCNGEASPRASYGSLPATYRLDLGVRYAPEWGKGMTLSMDVFNVFNRQSMQNVTEQYNLNGTTTVNPDWNRAVSYSAPRSVQFTARYDW